MLRVVVICALIFAASLSLSHGQGVITTCPSPVPNPPTVLEHLFVFDSRGANNSILNAVITLPESQITKTNGIPYYNGNLYVSDFLNERVVVLDPTNPSATNYGGTTFPEAPVGMKLDRANPPKFIWCEQGDGFHRLTSHTLGNLASKVVLTDEFNGHEYNSPRDVAIREDGILYFTDQEVSSGATQPTPGVYRYIPSSGKVELLCNNMTNPVGISFSPNQKILYVSDGGENLIRKFSVNKDGSINDEGVFTTSQTVSNPPIGDMLGPTGIAVDSQGNVYASGQYGEIAILPDGTHLHSQTSGRPAEDNVGGLTANWGPGEFGSATRIWYTANDYQVNRVIACIDPHPKDGTCTGSCWDALTGSDGACCVGERCTIVGGSAGCGGGTWYGAGSRCTPGFCAATRGACCFGNGDCDIVGDEVFCNGGTWKGVGSTCARCSGGCCAAAGTCSQVFDGNCPGGQYLGDGKACTGCARGACCPLSGGDCYEVPAGLCALDAVFMGEDTQCNTTDLCLAVSDPSTRGACCVGGCFISQSQSACVDPDGWQGVGSDCDPDPCAPTDGGTSISGSETDITLDTNNDGGDGVDGVDGADVGDGDGGDTVEDSAASRLSLC